MMKLPTLSYRRYRGDMLEMFKFSHGLYDKCAVGDFLTYKNSLRGHNYSLEKYHCKLDVRKYSFKLRVTNQWNNLPARVVNVKNINCFKSALDDLWKGSDVMYNTDVDIHKATSERRVHFRR